jgi:hypothetical protein
MTTLQMLPTRKDFLLAMAGAGLLPLVAPAMGAPAWLPSGRKNPSAPARFWESASITSSTRRTWVLLPKPRLRRPETGTAASSAVFCLGS